MKIKELDRTANVAWSPANQHPIYLAAGTAAQQLDATFSTTASLELYALNLTDSSQDMELIKAVQTESRFHKLVWGSYGMERGSATSGLLMAGSEHGELHIWDPAKIISEADSLVHKFSKHTGPVVALDINPFQVNLVASGASESEIFIWDLNSPDKPMTPGAKAQPAHDVAWIAWNRQVQHILASSQAGSCVVWDLRKNEPIIKIRDSMSHIKCQSISWHPDVATQLCMASEADHSPVIQLWDLRSATSPLKLLEGHQRGILSLSWCPCDSDLLLSCGKDNRILCWNPNTESRAGEVVHELSTGNQWSFDVQWCPRNPAMVSSCSFDGHVSVFSLMGAAAPAQTSNKIADAFPLDSFSQPLPQRTADVAQHAVLKKPPKWLRRPVGASFTFGGKLVSFEAVKVPAGQSLSGQLSTVTVSQVVTDVDLVARSTLLEATLASGRYAEFCDKKISLSNDKTESTVWSFLKVNFERDSRQHYLNLLGYSQSSVKSKVTDAMNKLHVSSTSHQQTAKEPTADERSFSPSPFDSIRHSAAAEPPQLKMNVDSACDGLITQALLTANFESAVDVCIEQGRWAEAVILAIAGGPQLLAETEKRFFEANKSSVNQLMWAIVTQKFETVVETCNLENWKEALAVVLTYAAGDEFNRLCDVLGRRLETETDDTDELAADAHLCYIVSGNTERLVASWDKVLDDSASHDALQDLVEKVMVLWKSVDSSSDGLQSGHLANRLYEYASLLASQGCLATALNYLAPVTSDDRAILLLKDRLRESLGHSTGAAAVQRPFNVVNVIAERRQQQQPPAMSHPQAAMSHQQAAMTEMSSAVSGQRSRTTSANYYQNAGDSVMKPSVYSPQMPEPTFLPAQAPFYPGPSMDPPAGLPSQSLSAAALSALSKGPLKKYGTLQQPTTDMHAPYADGSSQFTSHQATYAAAGLNASYTSPGAPSIYSPQSSGGAWNDPPVLRDAAKPSPADHAPGAPRYEGQLLNPAEYQPQVPQMQPVPQYVDQSQSSVHPAPPTAAVSAKPPTTLPEEHRVLQDVFNQLVQLCTARASNNPQIKRKLEDVLKKLDTLYSKLCTGSLSSSTVAGLHEIVQAIQQYDYQTALLYHAHVVGGGSFTEISAFMPGVKSLIQTAQQLQVYIQ